MTDQRVLVVDDDDLVRALVAEVLRAAGYDVVAVEDVDAALASIRTRLPSLVLSDVNMPGRGGFELLEAVRARADSDDVPFVFVTTRAASEDIVRALGLGADDYLVKPFRPEELVARVRAKIERPSVPAAVAAAQREHVRDLRRAALVQRGLLPRGAPPLSGYDLAGACAPSNAVGGDFYDWYEDDGSLVLTLADVMGKGVAGAITMATVRAALRGSGGSVAEAVGQVGALLTEDLRSETGFVTLFHATVDLRSGRVRFVDAGHGLVAIARSDGSVERLGPRGLPAGMFADATWDEGEEVLRPGDGIVVFSDGLLDGVPGEQSSQAVDRRVEAIAGTVFDSPSAGSAVAGLLASVEVLLDDVTVVVLKRSP